MARLLVAIAWTACVLACSAPAQVQVPENQGWVTDLAGFLDPAQERELEGLMESYRQGSTHEVALLTLPDLGGQPIERFALEVARAWKIGKVGENNGALLVVSRDDRKIRIEVGRGLEGTLTDSIAGRIIRNVIAPQFKTGNYYEGLKSGIRTIHAALGGEYASIPQGEPPSGGGHFGGLALMLLMFVIFVMIAGSRGGGRGRGRRRSSWPWWFLAGTAAGSSRGGFGGGRGGIGGGFGGGGFGGFGGGGGFSGGGASGGW